MFCFLAREYPRPKVYNVPQSLDWLTNKQFSNELNNIVKVINEDLFQLLTLVKIKRYLILLWQTTSALDLRVVSQDFQLILLI